MTMKTTDELRTRLRAGALTPSRELAYLRSVRRREVAERLEAARDAGGPPGENGDLLDALQEQELLEYRIHQLERRFSSGAALGHGPPAPGVVGIGSRVRVRVDGRDTLVAYEIVGTLDAAPASGRVSDRSPVGRALVGLRRGDRALVDAPGGRFTLEILDVEGPVTAAPDESARPVDRTPACEAGRFRGGST
jgi:transcription elongation factor GreA